MKAIEQKKVSIIRIFEDDKIYGDQYIFNLFCTYYGKFNEVAYLEGLKGDGTLAAKTAVFDLLIEEGVRFIKWTHKNKRGHVSNLCYDTKKKKTVFENELID